MNVLTKQINESISSLRTRRTLSGMCLMTALLLPALSFSPLVVAQQNTAQSASKTFQQAQLDQMLAPVALYPDSLLSQVLMASTYPADVVDAVQWSRAHPNQKGDGAVKAVENEQWDPSVQSLVAFPQVLATMGEKPAWVEDLGDAFLAQPDDVMDSVQRLRQAAQKTGNLKTSGQQTVVVEQAPTPQQTVIRIEPASPEVVYVPTYNPTIVYGDWWWPAYPPVYIPPPYGYGFVEGVVTGIGFGVGVIITNSLWGAFDWHHRSVYVDVNRYNHIYVNRPIYVSRPDITWRHDPVYRHGVPYRDSMTQQRYTGQPQHPYRYGTPADMQRNDARRQAQDSMGRHGVDSGFNNGFNNTRSGGAGWNRGGPNVNGRDDARRQEQNAFGRQGNQNGQNTGRGPGGHDNAAVPGNAPRTPSNVERRGSGMNQEEARSRAQEAMQRDFSHGRTQTGGQPGNQPINQRGNQPGNQSSNPSGHNAGGRDALPGQRGGDHSRSNSVEGTTMGSTNRDATRQQAQEAMRHREFAPSQQGAGRGSRPESSGNEQRTRYNVSDTNRGSASQQRSENTSSGADRSQKRGGDREINRGRSGN